MSGIRAFIAIPLTAAVQKRVGRLQRELKTGLSDGVGFRPSALQTLHLTLQFLGDQPPEMLDEIGDLLTETGCSTAPFEVALKGLGSFPSGRFPKVLWLGVEPQVQLLELHSRLAVGLRALGVPVDKRDYRPHLTLGRLLRPPAERETLTPFQDSDCGRLKVVRMVLYHSHLLSAGAVHLPLREVELGLQRID